MARISAWLTALMRLNGSPHGIAGGFALGVALSLFPIPFAGMLLALALAPVLRLNPPATYLGTAVVNPLTGAVFYFGELWVGLALLGQPAPSWAAVRGLDAHGWWTLATTMLTPFGLGATLFITVGGGVAYVTMFAATRTWQRRRAQPESCNHEKGRVP